MFTNGIHLGTDQMFRTQDGRQKPGVVGRTTDERFGEHLGKDGRVGLQPQQALFNPLKRNQFRREMTTVVIAGQNEEQRLMI